MTKEKILEQLRKENPFSISTHKAMDRWAEQQCIAFADWLKNNTIGFNMKYTTQQLYNQFIEQQNKTNGSVSDR